MRTKIKNSLQPQVGSLNCQNPQIFSLGELAQLCLFTYKTAWIKIAEKLPLESTEHKNGKDGNFRFG